MEDSTPDVLDRLANVLGEALVPGPPKCRLVGNPLEAQSVTDRRMGSEIRLECGFVLPAVDLLNHEGVNEREVVIR